MIHRDYSRTESDDFKLNVEDHINNTTWALPVRVDGRLVGWKLVPAYE